MPQITPFTFFNRRQQRIVGEILAPAEARDWCFISHGLGGSRAQPQMKLLAECAVAAGYKTVFYDSANSFGASGGSLNLLTPTTHLHDLEDVIAYCEDKQGAVAPYLLLGHSLGSFAILHYAAQHPDKIAALAPLSAVLGGEASWQAWQNADPKAFADFHRVGTMPKPNPLNPSQVGQIAWAYIADLKHYDILAMAPKITAPALLVVGAQDRMTPLHTQLKLKEKLSGNVEKHVIADSGHSFYATEALQQLRTLVGNWLSQLTAG